MDLSLSIIVGAYLLPSVVGMMRKHNSKNAILIINLLLGWTVLGWVIALAWSATGNVKPTAKAEGGA